MPLDWREVRAGLDPREFTVRTAPALLRRRRPWRGYAQSARPLRAAIRRFLETA
jgi:bifunctional non-homologous end joining protein LigD